MMLTMPMPSFSPMDRSALAMMDEMLIREMIPIATLRNNTPRLHEREDGTYALQVGEMGQIVDSDSGLHIILRTA